MQQPRWSPDGTRLYFIDDTSGWWNLYYVTVPHGEAVQALGPTTAVCPMEADFGFPPWVFGLSTYEVRRSYLHHVVLHRAPAPASTEVRQGGEDNRANTGPPDSRLCLARPRAQPACSIIMRIIVRMHRHAHGSTCVRSFTSHA